MNPGGSSEPAEASGARSAPGGRVLAVDTFRGLTIAAMLLVNNPGSWGAVWDPLEHAAWHGWTPTDLIFPFFLFVVGITTHLSLRGEHKRGSSDAALTKKIVRRAALIFLLGIALHAFPFVEPGSIAGIERPSLLDRVEARLAGVRIPGVLQRIAVVYLVVGFWELRAPRGAARGRVTNAGECAAIAAILLAYWGALTLLPVPGSGLRGADVLDRPAETLAAWSDRAVFGTRHLYRQAKEWDPEGALSTIPAIATGLLGLIAGRWIARGESLERMSSRLALAGLAGVFAGMAWGAIFPINKNLWTSSYVVFTSGAAALGLALCVWVIDIRGRRGLAMPWVIFGVNPLLAFVGSGVMARLLTSVIRFEVDGKRVPLQKLIYDATFAAWLPPHAASFVWAAAFVGLWLLLLWPLWKRGILLKI